MKIRKDIITRLIEHARKDAPIEACGYLGAENGIITELYPLTNVDKSSEHFSLDPGEQFSAMKDGRARGLEMCAVHHSHPATSARPSQEDIKLAHDPNTLYVIVSLAAGKEDIKAFTIRNCNVSQVNLEVIDDNGI
jgi:Predicted metal-dependent protease of the PAD1/JAB1 superfamily